MWKHESRQTQFCLCVDDFGIKYLTQEDADHLVHAIKATYECKLDWSGTSYLGLSLTWQYTKRYVDVSMPGYCARVLERLQHKRSARPQYSPHEWAKPAYGAKVQLVPDTPPPPPSHPKASNTSRP